MSIVAVDDGGLMSSPGTLTVTVARNDFAPEFLNLPNNVTVRSDLNTAQELFRCTFRDNDTEVCCCPHESHSSFILLMIYQCELSNHI